MADQWGTSDAIVKPKTVEEFGTNDEVAQHGALRRGWNKMTQSVGLTSDLATGDYKGAASRLAEISDYQQKNPGTPEGKKLIDAWNKGDGISGGLSEVGGAIAKDWDESKGALAKLRSVGRNVSAMGQGVLEQTPNMVAPMSGMLAGGVAGSLVYPVVGTAVGGWAGASLGNTAVEGGGMTQEALQKAGINPADKAATEAYLKENGDSLLTQAGVKGSIIGAVDTLTAGLGHAVLTAPAKAAAGRAITAMGIDVADKAAVKAASSEIAARMAADPVYLAATSGVKNVARNASVAALEPGGEFAGEYVGQGAATGEWDTKNAFLEAASSIGQGAATFAGQKLYAGMSAPFGAGDAIAAPATTPPVSPPGPDLSLDPNAQLAAVQSEEMGAPNVAQTTPPDGRAVLNAQQEQERQQREAQLAAQRAVMNPDDEIFASTGAIDPKHQTISAILATVPDGQAPGVLARTAISALESGQTKQIEFANASAQDQDAYEQAALDTTPSGSAPHQDQSQYPIGSLYAEVGPHQIEKVRQYGGHSQSTTSDLSGSNTLSVLPGLADPALRDAEYFQSGNPQSEVASTPVPPQQTRQDFVPKTNSPRRNTLSNQNLEDQKQSPFETFSGTDNEFGNFNKKKMSEEDKQASFLADGEIGNGEGQLFARLDAATRRAAKESKAVKGVEWGVSPVYDGPEFMGFKVVRKGNSNVSDSNGVQSDSATSRGNDGDNAGAGVGTGIDSGNGLGANTGGREADALVQSGEPAGGNDAGALTKEPEAKTNSAPTATESIANVQNPEARTQAEPQAEAAQNQAPEAVASDAAPAAELPGAGSAAVESEGVKAGDWVKPTVGSDTRARQVDSVGDDGWVYTKSGDSFKPGQFEATTKPVSTPITGGTGVAQDWTPPANQVSQPEQPGLPGEGAGGSQPTREADPVRQKALERIAEGKAWFGNALKAGEFIAKNGLKDTHEWVKTGASRFEVREKATTQEALQVPSERETRIASALANGGHVVGADLRDRTGMRLMGLTPEELKTIPADKVRAKPSAEAARTNSTTKGNEDGTQAAQAQPQQTQPEAGANSSVSEPATGAGVGGATEGVEKRTVESVARAIQQKVASNRRKYREKSRKEREIKGYAPNSTPESEQADYDEEISGQPSEMHQRSAAALIGSDPRPLIEMFVHGQYEASEEVFKEITGVRIRGLSAVDKKAALYKWANWTPKQIAQAEQSASDKDAARSEKLKQDDLKSSVMGAWLALDKLQVGETKVSGTETGQEFVIRTIASGFDKAHSQKKGVAPIYGFTDGKSFTTLKNGALTKFVKAAIAFGGLDKTMEYVNPPKPEAPAGFVDRSVETKKPNKLKQAAQDLSKARADYFTPGNIVNSYGGQDEVLSYTENDNGWFSVKVHAVRKVGDNWVRQGKPQDASTHSTQPDAKELAKGPVDRLGYQAAGEVQYSEPRADGKPFPNAVDRGTAQSKQDTQRITTDKAEMRPYRKPDGSVGYEAAPIENATTGATPEAFKELRKVAQDKRMLDGIELMNGQYVTMGQAANFAKKYMEPADWTKPFQFNRILDIAPVDWDRMVAAMSTQTKASVPTANPAQAATETVAKPERQYHLVAINEKTGAKTFLTRTPVTHAEAVTMKGKYDDKPGRRIQLEDVTPVEPASNPLDVPTDAQTQSTDAVKVGRFDHIQVPDETTRWMGFDGRKTVKADLQALAQRHSEYYQTAQQVRDDIEFVLGNPDGWYIHKDNKVVLFRERMGVGAIPQARVEVEAEADSMSVRSVYIGGKRQIAKKMADKKSILSGLDLGGQSPESLTISEYLKALGNGSSRPTSPSDEALKVVDSLTTADPEVKTLTPADVAAAEKQAIGVLQAAIDKMKAQEAQRFAARFLPTMGVNVPVGKARINAAMTDPKINLLGAADALNVSFAKSIVDTLEAKQEGRVADVADPKKVEKPVAAPIGDFGQKIGGAKKDTWTGFKDDLSAVKDDEIAGRKLSEIWPAPDYQKLIDDGMDVHSVAIIRSLRDEIPAKPRNAYKLSRWADQVQTLRALATNIMNGKDTGPSIAGFLERGNGPSKGIAGRADLYMAVGHDKSLEGIRLAHRHYSLYRGRENVNLWVAERDSGATAFSNWPQELATGDTKEDAIAAFKARYAELDSVAAVKKASFDIITETGKKGFFIGKKIGRNIATLAGPFDTVQEARAYRQSNLAALDEKLAKYKEIPKDRRDTNEPRVGEDMRNGQDVTPEMFAEAFGFKGVEFGNWVEQKRRQKDLNDAYDALMDMAAIMGVPAKAISLNGELGLAFGARGSGGVNPAAAHYESDKIVINLTKREGAGSLGHEWWHAVDNYFSRMRGGQTSPFMTTATDVGLSARGSQYVAYPGVRKEMIDAFGEVVRSIRATAMKVRSSKMDAKRTKEYWTTGEEMAARAFESYLISKLQDQDASNDYLANVVDQKTWDAMAAMGMQNEDSYPYPTAGEMPTIRAGFDKFFQTLETKETEGGNVAMFSRPTFSRGAQSQANESVDRLATGIASHWENAPKVVVAFDMNDPRIDEEVRKEDQRQRSGGAKGTPEGFYYEGTVYLMSSKLGTPNDIARVLFHEALGHYGLRGTFGKALRPILRDVAMLRRAEVDAKIKQYGLKMGNTLDRFTAAEEVLAELAQTKPEIGFVQRAIAAIRTWLRQNVPGFNNLRLTDAELIRNYILPARAFVENGRKQSATANGAPAFALKEVDGKSSVLSKDGKFQGWPKFNTWTRAEYKDVVSLLPKEYRYDSYRREPLPTQDRDARTAAALPEIKELNSGIGGAKGFGVDGLGNIVADMRDGVSTRDLIKAADIADKHGLGVFVTGVRTGSMPGLMDAGFVSEMGLGGVLARVTKSSAPVMPMASGVVNNTAYGTMMAYKPRGFAAPMFSRGTNESMTNNDVVGNQGGRSADDTTPGALSPVQAVKQAARDAFSVYQKRTGAEGDAASFEVDDNGTPVPFRAGAAEQELENLGWEVGTKTSGYAPNDASQYITARKLVASDPMYGDEYVTAKIRISNHGNTTKAHDHPDVNIAPGGDIVWDIEEKLNQKITDEGYELPVIAPSDARLGYAIATEQAQRGKPSDGSEGDTNTNESTAPDSGGAMFSRTLGETLTTAANNVHDVTLPAGYTVGDLLKSAPGKLNWWHKTVGTMYNLAERSPAFKRVFDGAQSFINDVSFYATEAADLAPTILPKLETWKDIAKSPLSPEDTKAISAPIFEGTLVWARDETGKPIKMVDLEAQAAALTPEQKAQRLLRNNKVSDQVLKMWQGLPIEQFESIINGKYERDMLKAGVVWKDSELKGMFNLTDKQIPLYREFRKATDKSLSNLAISDMLRFGGKDTAPISDEVLAAKSVTEASEVLRDYLLRLAEFDPERETVLIDTANKMIDKGTKAQDLIDRGYAPLSRYGQYTLDVVSAEGERVYFSMFESRMDAARARRNMEQEYPGATITQGTVSEEEYKLFAGVSPETLELFGDMLGLEAQGDSASAQAFQTYLKLAKSNRSSMKRLIQRKGIAGFNEDAGRVLAGFVYSNARQTSSNLHMGSLSDAANTVAKQQGELKDQAVRLVDYIKNPREEAQALRGLLFAQYIGGSVASAMVNMTQPLTMTFPWLSQYGGVTTAAKQMAAAVKDSNKKLTGDARLDAALKRAEEDGTVSPQEVHQLMQQSQGKGALQSGDGTKLGNAAAAANNTLSRISVGWGKLFSLAEQFNRRVTFIAAYRTAVAQGMADPDGFARKAIAETQGIYNKGNKPAWARGAVGSVLFTFKQYSIAYVEMLQRMATQGGPEGKKAALLALGVLFLMGGAGGMPGADDLDDLISGILQRLGYNFDSKQKRKEFFAGIVGEGGAQFLERGISGLPGVPLDVSGRMGMGNLLPGTGLLTKKTDYTRDVAEIAGPAGDFVKRGFNAAGKVLEGEIGGAQGAVATVAPKAAQNLFQAYDMANMGMYRDAKGMKVLDTDGGDAVLKAIGFQPNDVKKVQDASFDAQRMIGLNKLRETEIANRWAQGIFEKDTDKVKAAREELTEWNATNADSPIRINFKQILQRVQKMNQSKAERITATAPKEIRADVRRALEVQ